MGSKIEEAQEHIKAAEKYMKTGFLKRKPDYDGAADEYNQAAICFRAARKFEDAVEYYEKASNTYIQANARFHAANKLQEASQLCRDLKPPQLERAANMADKAGDLFLENGTPDTAAIAMERAAKALETDLPDRAIQLYLKAITPLEMQQKFAEATEAYGNAARVCTRQKQFDRALELQQKRLGMCSLACEASSHGGGGQSIEPLVRTALGGVVVALACKEDARAAQAVLDRASGAHGAFHESQEAAVLQALVSAYAEADEVSLNNILKNHLFKYCENEYARLVKTIKLSAVAVAARRPPKQAAAAPAGSEKVTEDEVAAEFAGLGVGSAADEEKPRAPPLEAHAGAAAGADPHTMHAESSPAREPSTPATATPDSAAAAGSGSSALDDLL